MRVHTATLLTKITLSRDFWAIKIQPRPHINRQKRFRKIFCFREDFQLQSSKIACPCSQRLRGHTIISLIQRFSYFLIIAIGCVNTFKFIFRLIVPLKHVRILQSFPKVSV